MRPGFEQDAPNLSDSFGVFMGAVTRRDDLFRGGAFKMGAPVGHDAIVLLGELPLPRSPIIEW
jgi:hypothetical protein